MNEASCGCNRNKTRNNQDGASYSGAEKAKLPYVFVHCGQHYDYNMAQQFIENLELPAPDYNLKIEATSPGVQTASIMIQMDQLLNKIEPSDCFGGR